ncbi:MAG: hypothetical protein ACAI38_25640 [Myxococcota bacterium]
MIVSALALLCLTAPSAPADTDFALAWRSGEISRDASHFETTWTLKDTTLTVHGTGSGHSALPTEKDTEKVTTLAADALKTVAEHLAAIDAAAKKHRRKDVSREGRFTQIRYAHGKQTLELFFPYWLDDVEHRPKNESKARLEVLEKLEALRAKLFAIGG